MVGNDYISNSSMIHNLAKTGDFEKYGIKTKEELDVIIEMIPKEFIHIKSAIETAWIFKNNDSSKSLFEIRNRLQQEIKYLDAQSTLMRKNVNIDYSKLKENFNSNELDGIVEIVTKSNLSNDERFKELIRKDNNSDYFTKVSTMNRINTIKSSFEEQISKIDNAINKKVINTRARNRSR